jgi:hypothetical protein
MHPVLTDEPLDTIFFQMFRNEHVKNNSYMYEYCFEAPLSTHIQDAQPFLRLLCRLFEQNILYWLSMIRSHG